MEWRIFEEKDRGRRGGRNILRVLIVREISFFKIEMSSSFIAIIHSFISLHNFHFNQAPAPYQLPPHPQSHRLPPFLQVSPSSVASALGPASQ